MRNSIILANLLAAFTKELNAAFESMMLQILNSSPIGNEITIVLDNPIALSDGETSVDAINHNLTIDINSGNGNIEESACFLSELPPDIQIKILSELEFNRYTIEEFQN